MPEEEPILAIRDMETIHGFELDRISEYVSVVCPSKEVENWLIKLVFDDNLLSATATEVSQIGKLETKWSFKMPEGAKEFVLFVKGLNVMMDEAVKLHSDNQ